ncbi:MAG: flagellar hook-associated protein FlgK [Lautropia sp.]|nr:flagellar hook-associated protein FlgK [Lautropia sp.]
MAGLIGIGQSALAAAYTQLQTAGHNIANVHTPGYVRQEVLLATAPGQYHGSGYIGNGVNVTDIRRNYDQFMAQEVTRNTALAGADSARTRWLEQVDQLLADTGSGIGAGIDEFRSALADLVNTPGDDSARTVIVHRADELARRFADTADALERMNTDTNRQIEEAAKYVNIRLNDIARLNQQITEAKVNGHEPNDLLDQRDALIDEVASKIQVSRDAQADGSVDVYTAGGHSLVLSNRAGQLVLDPGSDDPSRPELALDVHGQRLALNGGAIGSGEIAGLMRFRDQDLLTTQTRLGQLAASFAGAYNEQQALGVDANGNVGQAMFTTGSPRVLSGANNTGDLELTVTVDDAQKLKAADYRLSFDGGIYRIESLVSRESQEFAQLPDTFEGLKLTVDGGAMAAGDVIKIQSGSAFAGRMSSNLTVGGQVAAAYALSAAAGSTNAGNVRVASFRQQTPDANSTEPVTVTFTAPDRYSISGTGTGDLVDQEYRPGQPITANGWSLVLDGTPQAGDTVQLGSFVPPTRGNGNARDMAQLPDAKLVDGSSFNESYAALLSDVGSRTLQSKTASKAATAMLEGSKAVVAKSSGVNLDEEAARLLQYRQAYQAAAKVIQTADEMFNSILALAR